MERKAFEIFYANGEIVTGTTKKHFEKAPPDGIQFVIVRETDGSITIHKGAEVYEFAGARKKGSLTDDENYQAIKSGLRARSKLLVADRDPKELRRAAILRQLRARR